MNAMTIQTRLPIVESAGVTVQEWKVLTEAIWPGAKSAEAVAMAISYCRARKLDPFKRPVHIVPVWNSVLRKTVETIWPGISEIQTTAARTGQWAGMDAPQWGPDRTETFSGSVGPDNSQRHVEVTITYPEWCSVTVYRMLGGQRCAFCEPVYWLEAYAKQGRTTVPNEMWAKRVRGQIHKVAKAASLRAAFPEEAGNDYTAEEMEGQSVETGGITIESDASENMLSRATPTIPADIPALQTDADRDLTDSFIQKLALRTDCAQVRAMAEWAETDPKGVLVRVREAHRPDLDKMLTEAIAAARLRCPEPAPDVEDDAGEPMPEFEEHST
jgi:phage recombination protein Bet